MVVEREWLRAQLLTLGFHVPPSVTNFLYAFHPLSTSLGHELQQQQILVKFGPTSGLSPESLRITIGRRDDHEHLLQSSRMFLSSRAH
jgi:histidinol-phosphate/aromatic aminotransferase/cobyric acid decarboxylase-like protein